MKVLSLVATTAALVAASDFAAIERRIAQGGTPVVADCCVDNMCTSELLRVRTVSTNPDGTVSFNIMCPPIEGEQHNNNDDNFHLAPLSRFTPHDYNADGVTPFRSAFNARAISNQLHQQTGDVRSAAGLTDMVTFFGQFLDHDIGETLQDANVGQMPITIPTGDPVFDPTSTGTEQLGLTRSVVQTLPGSLAAGETLEQLNEVTAWIDASNVYGETTERAAFLRSFSNGELRSILLRGEEFPPFNAENAADQIRNGDQGGLAPASSLFVGGDARANEQPTLLVMHTLFLREHNWHANRISSVFPEAADDSIFQLARRFVIAENQVITYEAWLPALAGSGLLPPYNGHDADMDASLFNYFPHASLRLGHTLLNDVQVRLDANGDEHPALNAALADGFFNPQVVWAETGLSPYLRGLAVNVAQEMDVQVVDAVRNMLFGNLGFANGDLPALNVQRARDHGLPGYEASRRAFGLPSYNEWTEVTSNLDTALRLFSAFGPFPASCGSDGSVDCTDPANLVRGASCCLLGTDPAREIDPWPVSIAEDHVGGGNLGALNYAAFQEVFTRFREGDFFFYLNPDYLLPQQREFVQRQTLGDIIVRNTADIPCVPENVFIADPNFSFADSC